MRQATFLLLAILLILTAGCAKQYIITDPLVEYIPVTVSCGVGEMADELPTDFPSEKKPSLEDMIKFKHEIISAMKKRDLFATISYDHPNCEYEVSGAILDFNAGSGFARFVIGFGAGAAKVLVRISMIETATDKVVFAGNFYRFGNIVGRGRPRNVQACRQEFCQSPTKGIEEAGKRTGI